MEKGYKVLEIYEVYEYQVTQYNPVTGEGGFFVDYINTFLKLKAEPMEKRGKLIQCSCPVSPSYVVFHELVNHNVTDTTRDVALRSLLTMT